jgi:hypothetical protein
MYPGAGHMLMQERPRDVTQRLASLVRKVAVNAVTQPSPDAS